MLIDSHTHLYLEEFEPDKHEAVNRAIDAGVKHMMFPNVDAGTIGPMNELAAEFPGIIDMAIGLHPTEVNKSYDQILAIVEHEAETGRYKSIGEIGMDLYWDQSFVNEQAVAFERQCRLATELSLPVIIHCRKAIDEILQVFDRLKVLPQGVFHSFGGTAEDVKRIRNYGDFYFGINGIVTFKNSKLRDVLPIIGIDRILLETDSPYLAPVPMRGKRNESAFLIHTAAYVSNVLNVSVNRVAEITTGNYRQLFGVF